MENGKGKLPLQKWREPSVPYAQQIVLDSQKTSLMLQNQCPVYPCEMRRSQAQLIPDAAWKPHLPNRAYQYAASTTGFVNLFMVLFV